MDSMQAKGSTSTTADAIELTFLSFLHIHTLTRYFLYDTKQLPSEDHILLGLMKSFGLFEVLVKTEWVHLLLNLGFDTT